MKKFYYSIRFSPYLNFVIARNKAEAWDKIKKDWPGYDVKKICTLAAQPAIISGGASKLDRDSAAVVLAIH